MKKLLTALIVAVIVVASFLFVNFNGKKADKREHVLHTGILGYHGITEQAFQSGFDNFRDFILSSDDEINVSKDTFIKSFVKEKRVFHFYDSLMAMMMDLKNELGTALVVVTHDDQATQHFDSVMTMQDGVLA